MRKFIVKIQSGFSLISAIFLLVVLSALGTMMVTFFVAQQQSSALDVMGSRAYQAARAGIEWGAYNISTVTPGTGCNGIPSFAGTLAGNLSPFSVTLNCSVLAVTEGSSTIYVYDLTSTATGGGTAGTPDYVERVISVKMGR